MPRKAKSEKSEILEENKASETSLSEVVSSDSQKEPETMEELLAQTGYSLHGFKRGSVVEGVVASVSNKEVLIDVGGKTEGVIIDKEMELMGDFIKNLKVGEKVTCYVVIPENDFGQVVLSLRRAGADMKWKKLIEAKESGELLTVRGLETNKGGLIVEWEGLRGFIPASQLDFSYSAKVIDLINKTVQVKVIEVDSKQNRIIFSQKVGLTPEKKKELLSKIKIGEKYEGTITGTAPFGIFVNVLDVEGLVHISEISWQKVGDPKTLFKAGDKVQVLVMGINEDAGKLNLSIKQLLPDPWQMVAEKYVKDQAVKGKISKIMAYGAFVDLEPGISGLIHISKLPPDTELIEGQDVECLVESVDTATRRISLSLMLHVKPVGYK